MKYIAFLFLLSLKLSSVAQVDAPVSDTSSYPYWIEMMSDPSINFFQTQRAFELYWENRAIEKGSGYKPFKRWEYSTSELIDDYGNIPKPGELEAKVEEYIKNYHQGGANPGGNGNIPGSPGNGPGTCLTSGKWVEIGPYQLSGNRTSQPNGLGRLNAIGFHPSDSNIFYVGAPAGGLWSTKDGGKTWTSNTDTLPTLGVSAIVVDPIQPDTIYLGTGDRDASDSYGRGVIRSRDGGKTWEVANSGMGNAVVGKMVCTPSNPLILIAATSSGIYRSVNGANSWTRTNTGNFKEIVMDAYNSDILFATNYSNSKFYRSTDNGVNWTQITSGLPSGKSRMAVDVTAADSNFVYVIVTESRVFEGLYLSTDRGLNFKQISNSPNIMDYSHLGTGTSGQAWYDLDIAADPKNKSIIYVGGVNIFKSADSGATWKINAHWVGSGGAQKIHADQHVLEYQPGTDKLFSGNDGGIYFTSDGGKKWEDISKGLGIAQIYRLGQSATDRDLIINGYQDNGTGMYESGSWYTVMGGDGMDCAINASNSKYAYSDLYYGDVRRYTNGSYSGKIAANGTNGINESGGWVTPLILQEGTPSTMFIGYKNIWRSTNIETATASNVSWTQISSGLASSNSQNITYLENSPADPKLLYVARADNKFFKTSDVNAASPTWTDLTSSLPNTSDVDWIESHSDFKDRLWISQSNKVYQSDNGGTSWTNISNGLPNIPILSLVFDSSSSKEGLYAGTYMGVFYKDSTMSNWIWYNEGMPINTRVRDIEIYYDPSGRSKSHIVAATYGRGNWRSPLYDEDQKPPVADFNVDMKKVCANEPIKFDDVSLNNPTRWKWVITPANASYLNGTDSCSQHVQVKFNAPGKYAIKLVVDNCGGIDSVERLAYIEVFSAITPAVCINSSSGIGNYNIGIIEVSIDTFNNVSLDAFAEGEYMNRACTDIFYAKSDTTYAFEIKTGKSYKENVKIYIDYNNNGDLSDAGELAYSGPKQLILHQDSLRIPKIAVFDKLLRMRIIADFDTIPDNPCATLKYGQTEDFGIVISPRLPTPHFVAEFDSICFGETIKFSDSSEGSIYNYHWVISQGLWSDSSSTSGDQIFNLPNTGFYSLTLYLNDKMVLKKQDSAVFVQGVPNLGISLSSGNQTGCEGRNIELNTTDSNALVSSFLWIKDNNPLGETSSKLVLNDVVVADSGTYQVIGNYFGCADTSELLPIQIHHTPIAAFDINNNVQCFNENTFVLSNNSSLSSGSMIHFWTFDIGNTSSLINPSYSYGDTGTFDIKLRVSSLKGCADSLVKTVSVLESPMASFSLNLDSQCLKGNQFVASNNSSVSSGTNSFNWKFGDGNNSTKTSTTHQYLTEGLFTIELEATSTKGCQDTASMQVRVHPQINSILDWNNTGLSSCAKSNLQDIRSNSTILSGSIVYHEIRTGDGNTYLSNLVSNYTYQKEGLYTLVLIEESDKGCRDTISPIQVSINPVPKMSFSLNDTIQCFNQNIFTVSDFSSITSGSINNYSWDFGDGSNATSNTPAGHSYSNIGTFSFIEIGTSDQGCKDTSLILVQVLPSPEVEFDGDEVCLGENILFKNNSTISNGSISNYNWRFGDGQGSTSIEPLHRYSAIGTFNVELIANSNLNCLDTLTKSAAVVHPIPNAQFDFMKVRSWEKETDLQFKDASSTDVTDWLWTYDGLGSSTEQNPLVTFNDTGETLIKLFVKNAIGCSDTSSQLIFIFPETAFYIPTSFSPNNDELNDNFKVSGLAFVKDYHLVIVSRWGEVLFESDDINKNWDGTSNGKNVQSGSYLWIMELTDLNNTIIREKGSVLLLR